jgi:hypothetical protein
MMAGIKPKTPKKQSDNESRPNCGKSYLLLVVPAALAADLGSVRGNPTISAVLAS